MIGTVFSGYRVLDKIGGGNTGVVYKAFDPQKERLLALKVLPNDILMNREKRARFIRESRAAGMLSHAAIARLFQVGESDGSPYLAMEFVDGQCYKEIIETHPNGVGVEDFYKLALPLLEGMAYAHGRHIAHRDLKPSNLKLTSDGQPKILDFGLVKFLDAQTMPHEESFQTMAGMVLGSAGYMSPEQAEGDSFDERTDVFSLGVIMYELLTGKNPFIGRNPFDTITKVLNTTPLSVELLRPDAPLRICQVILRCLSKNMQLRYPNAQVLLKAVVEARAGA